MGSSKPHRTPAIGRRRSIRAGSFLSPTPPPVGHTHSTRSLYAKTGEAFEEPSTPQNTEVPSLIMTNTKNGVPQRNYTPEERLWIFEQAERLGAGYSWEELTADFNTIHDRAKEPRMIKNYYLSQYRDVKKGRSADPRGIRGQGSAEAPALKTTTSKTPARRKVVIVDNNDSDDHDELDTGVPSKRRRALTSPIKFDTSKKQAPQIISKSRARPKNSSDATPLALRGVQGIRSLPDGGLMGKYQEFQQSKKIVDFDPGANRAEPRTRVSSQKSGVILRPRLGSRDQIFRNFEVTTKTTKSAKSVRNDDDNDEDEDDEDTDTDTDTGNNEGDEEEEDDDDDGDKFEVNNDCVAEFESEYEDSSDALTTDAESGQEYPRTSERSILRENKEVEDIMGSEEENEEQCEEYKANTSTRRTNNRGVSSLSKSHVSTIGIDKPSNKAYSLGEGGGENISDEKRVRSVIARAGDTIKVMGEGGKNGRSTTDAMERKGSFGANNGSEEDGDDEEDKGGNEEVTRKGFITAIPIDFGKNINRDVSPSSSRKTLKRAKPLYSANSNRATLEHISLPLPSLGRVETGHGSIRHVRYESTPSHHMKKSLEEKMKKESVLVKHVSTAHTGAAHVSGLDYSNDTSQVLDPSLPDKVYEVEIRSSFDKSNIPQEEPGKCGTSTVKHVKPSIQSVSKKGIELSRREEAPLDIVESGFGRTTGVHRLAGNSNSASMKGDGTVPEDLMFMNSQEAASRSGIEEIQEGRPCAEKPSRKQSAMQSDEKQSMKEPLEETQLPDMPSSDSFQSLMSSSHVEARVDDSNNLENHFEAVETCYKETSGFEYTPNVEGADLEAVDLVRRRSQSIISQRMTEGHDRSAVANPAEEISKRQIKRLLTLDLGSPTRSAQSPAKKIKLSHAECGQAMAGAEITPDKPTFRTSTKLKNSRTPNPDFLPLKNPAMFLSNDTGIRRIYVDRGAVGVSAPSAIPGEITWNRMPEEGNGVLERVLTTEFREIVEALTLGRNDRRLVIYTCSQSAIEWVTVHHIRAKKTQWRTQWGIQVPPCDQYLIEKAVALLEERKNGGKEIEFKRVWGGKKVYEGLVLEAQREHLEVLGQSFGSLT